MTDWNGDAFSATHWLGVSHWITQTDSKQCWSSPVTEGCVYQKQLFQQPFRGLITITNPELD